MKPEVFSQTATCGICGEEVKLRSAKRHLEKCREQNPLLPISKKETEIFMLRIRGKYQKNYVLIVEMAGNNSLEVLDDYLRSIWLECCGHLSAFTINGETYDSYPADFVFPGEEPNKVMDKVKLSDVLTPGLKFTYEYDFGSTTDLELEVLDLRETFEKRPSNPVLVMRNKPPQYTCEGCDKPATIISSLDGSFYCSACVKADETNEDDGDEDYEFYGLPIVNSPRTGVCAYDTET